MGLLQEKLSKFRLPQMYMERGVYPYFREIDSAQDTEVLMDGKKVLMFGSNSYLGLTHDSRIIEAAIAATRKYGTGCAGSRLLNGTLDIHVQLEKELAEFVGKDEALCFSTGFTVNEGVIPQLVGRGDYIICDDRDHASIVDGRRLTFANQIKYKHNDMEALERELQKCEPDAIKLMTEKAANYAGIEVVPLKVKYPQGGEKQLIDAVIGRQVPAPPAIPINVGAVVQNVGTAYAVYEAVQKNKPLFERIVTVTGKSVKNPSNFLTRMGTPMSQLIEAAGGLPEDTGKVIGGGPMMGKALANTEVPICKGSSGVLIMNEKEARRAEPQPCIRCAKCVSACPMGLEPFLLATCSAHGDWERVEHEMIMSCIECGSCQFTCPSHRPMLDYIRLGKGKVGGIIRARNAKK